MEMYYSNRKIWSSTPLNGAEAVVPNTTTAAKCKMKVHSDRANCRWQGAHTYVTLISPTLSGEYPIDRKSVV